MDIWELVKLSIKSLFSFKVRSFLTMLGIIVGIASVVLISSVGAGFQNNLLGDLTKSLTKIVEVDIDQKKLAKTTINRDFYFKESDLEIIEQLPNIDTAFFETQLQGITDDEVYVSVRGVNDKNLNAYSYRVDYGRKITEEEYKSKAEVAIMNYDSAVRTYGNPENALGKLLNFSDFDGYTYSYTIVGVTQKPEQVSAIPQHIINIFVPVDAQEYNSGFTFKVKDEKKMTETVNVLKGYLKAKSGQDDLYKVSLVSDELKEVTGILNKISIFISFIAGISLLVGGIGVMNIMLVSVTERISEIGLRKAIGAKNKHILLQFLIESIILTLTGGLIGLTIGYGLASIIGIFLHIIPILKISVLIMSLTVSMGTGLIFGIYPARKASKLSPMEALRSE